MSCAKKSVKFTDFLNAFTKIFIEVIIEGIFKCESVIQPQSLSRSLPHSPL